MLYINIIFHVLYGIKYSIYEYMMNIVILLLIHIILFQVNEKDIYFLTNFLKIYLIILLYKITSIY